jgi:predicted RNA-binding Zn ribbon-like protein
VKQDRSEAPKSDGPAPLLADHPALDFLNTRPGIRTDSPVEYIANGEALLTWLVSVVLLSRAEANGARQRFTPTQLDALAAEARALRERLRPAVATWQRKGAAPGPVVLADLNRVLAAGPTIAVVESAKGRARMTRFRRGDAPVAVLTPVAEAFADLFAAGERRLVRECEAGTCSLWFYDRTKAHRRRWCSMSQCGARAKAAAYRARKRHTHLRPI